MRRLLAVAVVCVACAMVGAGAFAASEEAAPAAPKTTEIVGTLLSAQAMYEAGNLRWYAGELRVDEAGAHGRAVGDVLAVRYLASRRAFGMSGPGTQVLLRAHLESTGPDAEVWVAATAPDTLGRGEFIRPGEGAVTDLGSPKARILVKMLAPLTPECHQRTARLLRELASAAPERVRVQIFDMATPAGRQETQRERLTCATVLVNNRHEFTLTGPDGERKVALHHRPNEPQSSYHSEDVVAVVEQEIRRLYPE